VSLLLLQTLHLFNLKSEKSIGSVSRAQLKINDCATMTSRFKPECGR
jgi:hypothetical protein